LISVSWLTERERVRLGVGLEELLRRQTYKQEVPGSSPGPPIKRNACVAGHLLRLSRVRPG